MIDKVKKVVSLLSFVYVFLLVKYLGGYNDDVYSLILLVILYMSYTSFGINDSLNTKYASKKGMYETEQSIWNNAWSLNLVISLLVAIISIFILMLNQNLFASFF